MMREPLRWWRGHGTPPKNFDRWTELIGNFVKHCQSRYGQNEVRKWYFEAWNEPNLEGFWNGTQQQFFEMYKAVATTIKSIDPAAPRRRSFHQQLSSRRGHLPTTSKEKRYLCEGLYRSRQQRPLDRRLFEFLRKRESSFGFRAQLILIPPAIPSIRLAIIWS